MKKATVTFPINQHNQIILGTKMSGVGAGLLNGFGGKPELIDKTTFDTALRELIEETGGITANIEDLEICGLVDFYFWNNNTDQPNWSVMFFIIRKYSGEATSSGEMADPTPYDLDKIPYNKMLPADREIVTRVLEGKPFKGKVRFNKKMSKVAKSHYEFVEKTVLLLEAA